MSNDQRETKEIILPESNKRVVIYTYLTGGENRIIQSTYAKDLKASDLIGAGSSKDILMSKVPASVVFDVQEKALKMLLVSIDGVSGVEAHIAVSNLRSTDYDYVLGQVDEVLAGVQEKKS